MRRSVGQDDIEHLLRYLSGLAGPSHSVCDRRWPASCTRFARVLAPAAAYDLELQLPHDPGTDSLPGGKWVPFIVWIASRNEALDATNANLEEQAVLHAELTASNESAKIEQNSLHLASKLEMTQRKRLNPNTGVG